MIKVVGGVQLVPQLAAMQQLNSRKVVRVVRRNRHLFFFKKGAFAAMNGYSTEQEMFGG